MSRLSRTAHPPPPVAALHERQGVLALVVLATKARPAVTLARTFKPGHEAEIAAALASAGVPRLIRIAPAHRTVCRVAPVPPGTPDELAAATSLLAEGTLPEDIPAHRRAAGILPGWGPSGATALLTAWRSGDPPPTDVPGPDQRWTTEIAALAFLCDGRASAVSAGDPTGAISIFAAGGTRAAARVLVETTESGPARDAAVQAHVAETCASVGAAAPQHRSGRSLTLADATVTALRARLDGVPADAEWLETYGLALGAALVALSPAPGAPALAGLVPEPPSLRTPWPERAVAWLSVPRHSVATIAAAVAIAVLAPLGFAAGRAAVLTRKAASLPDQDKARATLRQRAALYREMEQLRWPMTKLLADISAATPEGVSLDSITLAPDTGVALKGNAENQEVLTQLQKNLNDTGIFEKLKVARAETTSSGVSFDVSAGVINAHTPVKPADDFAKKPLSVRLYGESAAAGPADEGRGASEPTRRGGRDREDRAERRNRAGDGPSARPAPAKLDIPPPLSDEQIAAMTEFGAVLKEWTNRQRVANSGQADAATKARLEHEVEKLKERREALKQGGPK